MKILPEPGWERLLGIIRSQPGTVMLLGSTDSGKTTLARYLVTALATAGFRTALIDSDIGQSGLGLPGTISMKVFRNESDARNFGFELMTFLGFTNPAKVMPLMVSETGRLTDIAKSRAGIVVVDTTGLISGEMGKALKTAKVRAIRPAHIVAIQRENELEHILALIGDTQIHRLTASSAARRRTASSRSAYRKRKLAEYFKTQQHSELILDAAAVQFFYRGRQFYPGDKIPPRTLIGLNRNDRTIALGIIEGVEDTAVFVRSPLSSLKGINRAVCGDLKVSFSERTDTEDL